MVPVNPMTAVISRSFSMLVIYYINKYIYINLIAI